MNRLWIAAALLLVTPVLWLCGPTRATASPLPRTAEWLSDPARLPDPATAMPAQVAAFFAGLSPAAAADLTARYPQIVGNLDGAPLALRYAANRDPARPGRQILALDRRGDGMIATVLGDLETADRVAILIPGVDTTLANFDTGLGGVLRRAPSWQAEQLFAQIRRADPGARVAVIAWLGYDTPEGVRREALREDRAASGAPVLEKLVDGLVTGHPDRAIVVVGHSYGSIVAGHAAARLSRQVTDIVAIGSPGMGVPDRSALGTAARVWAGSAPDDWTRRLPGVRIMGVGHGRQPAEPDFGALTLPCDDVTGHDGYYAPGTASLRAMARIVAGAGDAGRYDTTSTGTLLAHAG
ncbi:alpha/beta hydrolase [Actinoplanes rectilineatus]|uniref:alpha/beta hydrolase n=1 Tax=Actinoplanes rectilineatus TaxID=113571 RepID=UPI0005F2AA90|nr:alpha/beta hydrolase [Actinoplanes rectilineatus]